MTTPTDDFEAPVVSIYQRRLWIWCDARYIDQVNLALKPYAGNTDPNKWAVFTTDQYNEGGLVGWSMTPATFTRVMDILDPYILDGYVQIWPDEHGNTDTTGREMTGGAWRTRFKRDDVEVEKRLTRRPDPEETLPGGSEPVRPPQKWRDPLDTLEDGHRGKVNR